MTVVSMVLNWRVQPCPIFEQIMVRLRKECDPENPEADYYWSQRSMPTERKREAIIAECRQIGGELLPCLREAIRRKHDEEVKGMLFVIGAALGDPDMVKPAAEQMVWAEFPAVRISAAKTLRRLHDRRTIEWFRIALKDRHFVVNGGCGLLREQFFPVRLTAKVAMTEMGVEPLNFEGMMRRKLEEADRQAEIWLKKRAAEAAASARK